MIEETFFIKIPEDYKILKNTTESIGFAGADFEVNIELEFQKKEFDQLKKELIKVDSLKSGNVFCRNNKNEPSKMIIDENRRKLTFHFIHL